MRSPHPIFLVILYLNNYPEKSGVGRGESEGAESEGYKQVGRFGGGGVGEVHAREWSQRGRMKGRRVGGVEAEGMESEEENQRGLSRRSRSWGGGVGRGESEGAESEGYKQVGGFGGGGVWGVHRKKRFSSFPSPVGMSLPNSPWAVIMMSKLNYSYPGGVWLVTSRLETGNSWTFFTVYRRGGGVRGGEWNGAESEGRSRGAESERENERRRSLRGRIKVK
jgi:hypothetical protein